MFQILTIVGGLITASPLVVARKPGSAKIFARIAPYQGFLGIAMLALGIVWLLRWMPNLSALVGSVGGFVVLGMISANIVIGFLLGYGMLHSWFARSETAKAKAEAVFVTLTRTQVPIGIVAVGLGVVSFLV